MFKKKLFGNKRSWWGHGCRYKEFLIHFPQSINIQHSAGLVHLLCHYCLDALLDLHFDFEANYFPFTSYCRLIIYFFSYFSLHGIPLLLRTNIWISYYSHCKAPRASIAMNSWKGQQLHEYKPTLHPRRAILS